MNIVPEFKSSLSYIDFERTTKSICRYIFNKSVKDFLDTVLSTSKNRHRPIPKGTIFWRAQLGNDWKPLIHENEHIDDEPYPFPLERMKPQPHMASEGRANPKGIPYLYVANEKETSMAEVRPWLDSFISVGQLKTKKDITIIDCSVLHAKGRLIYLGDLTKEEKEEAVWADIDRAFSKPVTPNDSVADYIPTQILAELFKNNGIDGIAYKSNLEKGHNVVLFDINIAEVITCFLFQADTIKFSFTEAAGQYVIRKTKEKNT